MKHAIHPFQKTDGLKYFIFVKFASNSALTFREITWNTRTV